MALERQRMLEEADVSHRLCAFAPASEKVALQRQVLFLAKTDAVKSEVLDRYAVTAAECSGASEFTPSSRSGIAKTVLQKCTLFVRVLSSSIPVLVRP